MIGLARLLLSMFPWWIRFPLMVAALYWAGKLLTSFYLLVLLAAFAAWALVIVGVFWRKGTLSVPSFIAQLMEQFTGQRTAGGWSASASPLAQATQRQAPATSAAAIPQKPKPSRDQVRRQALDMIERLHGNDRAKQQIESLLTVAQGVVAKGSFGLGTVAPASLVLFHGPAGTGRTEMARAFIGLLYGVKALYELNIASIQSRDIIDAGGGGAGQAAEQLANTALDGALLIDNGEWLARHTGDGPGDFAVEVGRGLLHVAESNPGRLVIVVTGGPDLRAKLFNDASIQSSWLGKLQVDEIALEHLDADELLRVLGDLAKRAEVSIPLDLVIALKGALTRLQAQMGDSFDNVYAVRRIFDAALRSAKARGGSSIEIRRSDFAAVLGE